MVPLRSAHALAAALLIAAAARGQSTEDVERRFFAVQARAETVVARVTQTLTLPGSRRPSVSRADVLFERPGRLLIRYTEPAGDFVLLRDDTVISRKGDKPPVERPLARDGSGLDSWRGLLGGRSADEWSRDWERTLARDGDTVTITLRPKSSARDLPRLVTLSVDAESLTPRALAIDLRGGARLSYAFESFRRDAPLPAGAFVHP